MSLICLRHYRVVHGGVGAVQRHGDGDLQRRGSAAETGLCASDNTAAFDAVWPSSVGTQAAPPQIHLRRGLH